MKFTFNLVHFKARAFGGNAVDSFDEPLAGLRPQHLRQASAKNAVQDLPGTTPTGLPGRRQEKPVAETCGDESGAMKFTFNIFDYEAAEGGFRNDDIGEPMAGLRPQHLRQASVKDVLQDLRQTTLKGMPLRRQEKPSAADSEKAPDAPGV